MQMVTVGTKNQIVIPKEVRKKVVGIKPGQKLKVYASDKDTVIIKMVEDDWVERTSGAMKEAWKDIDPIAEIEKMRNEW